MNPNKDLRNPSSLETSRVSNLSSLFHNNSEMKRMQAKLLMDFLKQNQQLKQRKNFEQSFDKADYAQYEKSQTIDYQKQEEAKKRRKQQIKQKLAREYDQMIKQRQQKIRQERQKERQQQRKNFEMSPWGRDNRQQHFKKKKIQQEYGKQLQMHLRLQQMLKQEKKAKERLMIQKFQKEQYQQNLNHDKNKFYHFKKKQQFEKRQNSILGISHNHIPNPEGIQAYTNKQLQANDLRTLKRRQQILYGKGLEQQLRSQTISPKMINKYNVDGQISHRQFRNASMLAPQMYNPITNPIQINYKNPNVLRMLVQNNN